MNERMIQITQADMEKLKRMVEARRNTSARDQGNLVMLAHELERAEIVHSDNISTDTVTMDSHVLVRDLKSGSESTYALVFPADADIARGKISILAPIGTALLGYREGDEVDWPTPGGWRRLKIVKVLFQPEAAGRGPEHSAASHGRRQDQEEFRRQAQFASS